MNEQQVHHAARATLGTGGDLAAPARQRAPTIIPLEGTTTKVALHAVCRENVFWETLEELKEAGRLAMLVLPVEKMLA